MKKNISTAKSRKQELKEKNSETKVREIPTGELKKGKLSQKKRPSTRQASKGEISASPKLSTNIFSCQLLYQKGIKQKHEQEKKANEIKKQKEQQEKNVATFKPKINKTSKFNVCKIFIMIAYWCR